MRGHPLTLEATFTHGMKTPRIIIEMEMAKRAAAANRVMQKKAVRRNQSKLNQRRYRAEQKFLTDYLTSSVSSLRTEVARLEGKLESFRLSVPISLRTFEPETKVTVEYFRMFANGYKVSNNDPEHRRQHEFVTCCMSQDLEIMGSVGIDKLWEQWRLYISCFESFTMYCDSIEAISFSPNVVVHACIMLNLTISQETITSLLPNLLDDEQLCQRIIGKIFRLPIQVHFGFDDDFKVQRYETHTNTILALSNLLGNFEDTLKAVNGSHISDTAEINPIQHP